MITLVVVIYLRVSTEDQARSGYSIPEQREACITKAKALANAEQQRTDAKVELQIIEFVDTVSGELLERPGLDQLRTLVREQSPDYVVAYDPDRFSRTTSHAILVADEIEDAGTKLEFVLHEYQQTAEGKLFFTMRVAFAQYEKAKIRERTLRGRQGKIKAGGLPTGLHMYGYRYDKQIGTVSPDPEEARWVQQIFLWAGLEQLGCQRIADRLNALGIPTKRSTQRKTRWYRGTVTKLLRNRGYIGELVVNRLNADGIGVQRQLPKNRRTRKLTPKARPPEEWVVVKIPALITRELWDRVQSARPKDISRRSQRRDGLLSGLMVCGYCGGPVHYRPHPSHGRIVYCANRYPYMRDTKTLPPKCTSLPHQAANLFEDQVWSSIEQWLTNPDSVKAHLDQTKGPAAPSVVESLKREITLLQDQLRKKQGEQASVLSLVAKGHVDQEVADKELATLKEQIDHLRTGIAWLEEQIQAEQRAKERLDLAVDRVKSVRDEVAGKAKDIKSRLTALDGAQRQTLVRMLIRHVILYSNGVCVIDALP